MPVVPDQQPLARPPVVLADGLTREHLLAVVGDARAASDAPLELEGHGSSGVAVLSLAIHQRRLGLAIDHVACLDARGEDDPVSGHPLAVLPRPSQVATRITLVAGRDEASISWTAATAAHFRAAAWAVDVV